jgi:hypothetical protein
MFLPVLLILLRGIQLTHVPRYWGSTVIMVFPHKFFTFNEANTCVALPNAWRRSMRALYEFYQNNNGSESTVVKTVELIWFVFRVAEPVLLPPKPATFTMQYTKKMALIVLHSEHIRYILGEAVSFHHIYKNISPWVGVAETEDLDTVLYLQ